MGAVGDGLDGVGAVDLAELHVDDLASSAVALQRLADRVQVALARVLASGEIVWEPGETGAWNAPWPDHHTTKYESKAVKEGRKSVYLTFRRVATV